MATAKLQQASGILYCFIGNIYFKVPLNDSVQFVLFAGLMIVIFGRLYANYRKYNLVVNFFFKFLPEVSKVVMSTEPRELML